MHPGLVVVAAAAALVAGTIDAAAAHNASPAHLEIARFEGRWIDLSEGWGSAHACLVSPGRSTECFRTRAEMLVHQNELSPTLTCSSPLELYDLTYLGGSNLFVSLRGAWVNLADFGFDNRTSSFHVGACGIDMAALANGGGARYPRCLNPGCTENTMFTGWNNVVSSVYLH